MEIGMETGDICPKSIGRENREKGKD